MCLCPTVTQSPSLSPPKQCEDGSDSDSHWDLRDQGSDKIIVDVRYDVNNQTIVREVCKPRDDCYIFRLSTTDACALVFLNEKEIAIAPPEWEIQIGDSCYD
mmetsp:Transcript_10205/g.14657  ORF Transcript_10205/g.14657 Transcript_10205/m.14657 type:complete len:102 (+) Transcript_10205:399-704(+)